MAEDFDSPICLICTLVKSFNDYYYFKIVSVFKMRSHTHAKDIASDKGYFEVFPKEKGRFFIMPYFTFWSCFVTFCHAFLDIFCSKDKNFEFYNSFPTFWGKKVKFTIHLSLFIVTIHCHYSPVTIHLLLFMTLFTSNFCLFKGGCPLYLKQVFSVLSSGLLS